MKQKRVHEERVKKNGEKGPAVFLLAGAWGPALLNSNL